MSMYLFVSLTCPPRGLDTVIYLIFSRTHPRRTRQPRRFTDNKPAPYTKERICTTSGSSKEKQILYVYMPAKCLYVLLIMTSHGLYLVLFELRAL